MKLRITEAVLAEAYRAKVCRERMEELAESIRKSVKERHSLPKMRIRLAEYGNDTELMLAAVSALRKDKEAPSARDRDFRAWMLMLCRSREYEVICYMCNELTDAWERKYRTREMLVLCDVLHTLKGHARTNEMTNRVCDYFFRERRNKLYGKTFRIEEKDMAYAESRLPELDKAVFRMTVNHYSHRTFVAEELAGLCGMGYSLMRRKFKTYYGMGPSEWLRRERIRRIEEDMEYRVELPLKEVAERNAFGSASNFADFCQKQTGMSPCELKAIGHEKWEKRRMHIPGHTRSLSGSILRHKISLKSAILYPFIP